MGSIMEILNSGETHKVRMAEYEAGNMIRRSTNIRQSSDVALSEFSRTLGNNMRVEAAGKEYNEATSGLANQLESRTTGKINASLTAAEKLGALAAGAAASGVGGSTVEMLSSTIKLQRNIEQDLQKIETSRIASAGGRANAQVMQNAWDSTDFSQVHGSFDYTISISPKPLKYKWLKVIGIAAATYFGGPQAGQAASDAVMAEWKGQNGDLEGQAAYASRAVTGLLETYNQRKESGTAGTPWGAMMRKNSEDQQTQAINWGSFTPTGEESGAFDFGSGFGDDWNSTGWAGGSSVSW